MMLRRFLLAAAIVGLTPVGAYAQIYAWRDATGKLVLSDVPKDKSARTYAVPSASGFRSTRPGLRARASLYEGLIAEHAAKNALDPDFVRAVIQAESAFNPFARSAKGAKGLMQLMPETAATYGVRDIYDPEQNISAGVAYLKSLLTRYGNDVTLALAAYNAGPGAVDKYGRTVPPYRETRAYVRNVQGNATGASAGPRTHIYRTVEIVDGREVVRYTDHPTEAAKASDRR